MLRTPGHKASNFKSPSYSWHSYPWNPPEKQKIVPGMSFSEKTPPDGNTFPVWCIFILYSPSSENIVAIHRLQNLERRQHKLLLFLTQNLITQPAFLDRSWPFFRIFDWTPVTFCKYLKVHWEEKKLLERENLWFKNVLASLLQRISVYFIPSRAISPVTAEKPLPLSLSRHTQKLN